MTYPRNDDLSEEQRRTQEVEIAHERMRGHVEEIARLIEVGAPSSAFLPYLDQLRADLNTARPVHVGWANYQAPTQGLATTPTGLSGARLTGEVPPATFSERDAEIQAATQDGAERSGEPVGTDGLTDTERARGDERPAEV